MNHTINETHDPQRRSWVESANQPGVDFPIQNLPFGVFRSARDTRPHIGVAIGDAVLDLGACRESGLIDGLSPELIAACGAVALNPLMALPCQRWSELRRRVSDMLHADSSLSSNPQVAQHVLLAVRDVEMQLPAQIGDYSDFYASIYHATNV